MNLFKNIIRQLMQADIKVYIRLANVFLVVLLAFFISSIILIRVEDKLETKSSRTVKAVSTHSHLERNRSLTFYNGILQRNLFNSKESLSVLFDEDSSQIESDHNNNGNSRSSSSFSDFILRGTLFTNDENSVAVFESRSTKEQIVVGQGDDITIGVTLTRVHPESVTINRSGKLEDIPIYREQTNRKGSLTASTNTAGIRKSSQNKFEIDQDVLNKNLENVNQIISQIAMRPKMDNGVCIGYEIRRIKEGSIFEDIGLLKKDVLQSVNGMDLSNPEDAFRVYKSLIGETSFNIDLLRDGEKMSLNYEIR